jgi:hypothetical protein
LRLKDGGQELWPEQSGICREESQDQNYGGCSAQEEEDEEEEDEKKKKKKKRRNKISDMCKES